MPAGSRESTLRPDGECSPAGMSASAAAGAVAAAASRRAAIPNRKSVKHADVGDEQNDLQFEVCVF